MTRNRADAQSSWERPQITIRLTARRKELLARLAQLEGLAGPPGDAIDKALLLALREREDEEDLLRGIEARLAASDAARQADAAASRSALSQVAHELARLRELLAALSDEG